MHVPDHVMDPATCLATTAVSAAAVGYAAYRVYREFPAAKLPLLGSVAACVFAAQMVNFPVAGGTSGHLLGALLAAIVLGPWAGMLAITAVLLVQCFLFQDGGVTALGANVLNIAVVGSLVGYAVFDRLRNIHHGHASVVLSTLAAAWMSVWLGAVLCSVELAAGGAFAWGTTLQSMLLSHSLIGVGEAAISAAAVSLLWSWRPDLLSSESLSSDTAARAPQARLVRPVLVALAVAGLLVIGGVLFASDLPDGLESTLAALGHSPSPAVLGAPLADYRLLSTPSSFAWDILPGGIGVVVVFAAACLLAAGTMSRRQRNPLEGYPT